MRYQLVDGGAGMTRAERIAAALTPARRRAIANAFLASWGEWYVPTATRWDVRDHLVDLGLLARRPAQPLRKIGLQVRDVLLREAR